MIQYAFKESYSTGWSIGDPSVVIKMSDGIWVDGNSINITIIMIIISSTNGNNNYSINYTKQ